MKWWLAIFLCSLVAVATWPASPLDEPQLQLLASVQSANRWLGIGLCLEAVGMAGVLSTSGGWSDFGSAMIFGGLAGAGLVIQGITVTRIGLRCIRLRDALARDGSDTPPPSAPVLWSSLSMGAFASTLLLFVASSSTSSYETGEHLLTFAYVLEAGSTVFAGATWISVRTYLVKIGPVAQPQARGPARTDPPEPVPGSGWQAPGQARPGVRITLLSIRC